MRVLDIVPVSQLDVHCIDEIEREGCVEWDPFSDEAFDPGVTKELLVATVRDSGDNSGRYPNRSRQGRAQQCAVSAVACPGLQNIYC